MSSGTTPYNVAAILGELPRRSPISGAPSPSLSSPSSSIPLNGWFSLPASLLPKSPPTQVARLCVPAAATAPSAGDTKLHR